MRSVKSIIALAGFSLLVIAFAIIRNMNTPLNNYKILYDKQVNLIAKVEKIIDIKDGCYKYSIDNITVVGAVKSFKLGGKIKLSAKISNNNTKNIPETGDVIFVSGVLREPFKNGNSSDFFTQNYINSIQMYGSLNISQYNIKILKHPRFDIFRSGYIIKNEMELKYNSLPKREGELLKGIVFGDGQLSDTDKDEFAATGISHIIAVSGFNLAIIIYALKWIFKKIKFKGCISDILLIMTIWSFYILTGGGISILRAALMLTILILCNLLSIKYNNCIVLFIVLDIVLLISPQDLFSLGFYLSFLATLGIIIFYNRIRVHIPFIESIKNNVAVTIAAQILILPLLINCFNYVSPISVLINLITAPLAEAATVIGMLSAVMPYKISVIINCINYILTRSILLIVDLSCRNLNPIIVLESLPIIFVILYYIFVFSMLIKSSKIKYIIMGTCCSIMAVYLSYSFFLPAKLSIYAIDVGQGDSLFIKTPSNKCILIDGGGTPEYSKSTYDPGLKSVQPFLYSKGCSKIDLLVVTHSHEDHVNGLLSVVNKFKISNVILSKYMPLSKNYSKLIKLLKDKHANIKTVSQGDSFFIDKIKFDVLNPQKKDLFINTHSDPNNDSVVLKLTYMKFKMLFTGDIEHEAEEEILKSTTDLRCDVLKIGHHGSKFSSSDIFLQRVKPIYAIISVGKNNLFGHPNKNVIKRLKSHNIKIFRTDEDGSVSVKSNGYDLNVTAIGK